MNMTNTSTTRPKPPEPTAPEPASFDPEAVAYLATDATWNACLLSALFGLAEMRAAREAKAK